jgi:hypothetical protein
MEGLAEEPLYRDFPFEDLVEYWRKRWLLPRVSRTDGWHAWEPERLLESLLVEGDELGEP